MIYVLSLLLSLSLLFAIEIDGRRVRKHVCYIYSKQKHKTIELNANFLDLNLYKAY